jgi:hypothetical protein
MLRRHARPRGEQKEKPEGRRHAPNQLLYHVAIIQTPKLRYFWR